MYLLWALLNTAFVILFFGLVLTLFTKGKELFNNKYGNAIIVVFVLGVIGILGANTDKKENIVIPNDIKKQKTHAAVVSKQIHLESHLNFTIHLNMRYTEDANTITLLRGYSITSGFTNGLKWNLKHADVYKDINGTLKYEASGLLYWNLFGINFYTQNKTFTGTLE